MFLFEGNLNVCDFVSFLDEAYCSDMLTFMNRMAYFKGYVVKQKCQLTCVNECTRQIHVSAPTANFMFSSRELNFLHSYCAQHVFERSLHLGFVA